LEDQDIKKLRAEVIDKFINLETLMDAVITQHYFHQTHKQFMYEVLYDEYFSFALKRNILLTITEHPNNNVLNKLHRIGRIRNIFAHRGRVIVDWVGNSKRERVIDSKKIEKEIDFQELFKEYCDLERPVFDYLFKVFKEKGGLLILDEEELENLVKKK
jgi:hypothetical protein